MVKLRSLFTDAEVIKCLPVGNETYADMARKLTELQCVEVTRQLARYWAKQFDTTKKNGDHYLSLLVANRELKEQREIRVPKANDLQAQVDQGSDPSCILNFGDTHAPYHHPDCIEFLDAVDAYFDPTMVIHNGDEVDNHALSFHDTDPNLDSAGMELENARVFIEQLERLFPRMRILDSNHGSLAYRKAKAHGIPAAYIKNYREILFKDGRGKGWSWHARVRIENPWGRDMQFQHIGGGDLMQLAAMEGACLSVGHMHTKFGIGYAASQVDTYWSLYTGWLGDIEALAFAYGKDMPKKPVLGCAVIIAGVPQLVPMRLDKHNRWTGKL